MSLCSLKNDTPCRVLRVVCTSMSACARATKLSHTIVAHDHICTVLFWLGDLAQNDIDLTFSGYGYKRLSACYANLSAQHHHFIDVLSRASRDILNSICSCYMNASPEQLACARRSSKRTLITGYPIDHAFGHTFE